MEKVKTKLSLKFSDTFKMRRTLWKGSLGKIKITCGRLNENSPPGLCLNAWSAVGTTV